VAGNLPYSTIAAHNTLAGCHTVTVRHSTAVVSYQLAFLLLLTFLLSSARRSETRSCPGIEVRPTDRATTPARAGLHRCPGLGHTTQHALARYLAADHVTMKTYYYGGQSIEEDTNANETPIFALTFDLDL